MAYNGTKNTVNNELWKMESKVRLLKQFSFVRLLPSEFSRHAGTPARTSRNNSQDWLRRQQNKQPK